MSRTLRTLSIAVALSTVAAACSGAAAVEELRVSAAASLAGPFAEIAAAFEQENQDVDVVINLAGSSALREQVLNGAPVDVFASADPTNMDTLVAAGSVAGDPRVFATNTMAIATPSGNPAAITTIEDLATEGLLIGVCDVSVPCGELAQRVLANAQVDVQPVTKEPNVLSVLTKVQEGELDAGIVYRSDVIDNDAVTGVPIADDVNVSTDYEIAVVADSPNASLAQAFVSFVDSPTGRQILARHGFTQP